MPKRDEGLLVLWPHYFDAKLSRKAGRRVNATLAVEKPDAAWVEKAARQAGLKPTLEETAKHPSIPYKVVGRVVLAKSGSKEEILQKVAAQMKP